MRGIQATWQIKRSVLILTARCNHLKCQYTISAIEHCFTFLDAVDQIILKAHQVNGDVFILEIIWLSGLNFFLKDQSMIKCFYCRKPKLVFKYIRWIGFTTAKHCISDSKIILYASCAWWNYKNPGVSLFRADPWGNVCRQHIFFARSQKYSISWHCSVNVSGFGNLGFRSRRIW